MPPSQRAKQFMPFAAVRGLEQALREKERELRRVERAELSEEMGKGLDGVLRRAEAGARLCVTYYRDGEYARLTGNMEKLDAESGFLILSGEKIPLEDLLEAELADGGDTNELSD